MISISIEAGLLTLVFLWLGAVAFLWIRELRRAVRHDWEDSLHNLFLCPQCRYSFLTRDPVNLTRCPRCNTICFRRSKSRK